MLDSQIHRDENQPAVLGRHQAQSGEKGVWQLLALAAGSSKVTWRYLLMVFDVGLDVGYIEACWIYYWLLKKQWYLQKIKERMVEHVGEDWNKFLWLPAVLFILLFPSWIQRSGRSLQEIALLKTWRLFRKGVANRFLSRMPRRTCDLLMTTMMHCLWQVDFLRLSHSCHSHATLGSNAIPCINWILSAFFQVEPVWVGKTELASPWLRDWSFWWDSSRPRLHSQRFCFKAFQASLV